MRATRMQVGACPECGAAAYGNALCPTCHRQGPSGCMSIYGPDNFLNSGRPCPICRPDSRETPMSELPKYVLQWLNKQVRWSDGQHHHSGLVLDVNRAELDGRTVDRLRIARSDGFVEIGVETTKIYEVTDL